MKDDGFDAAIASPPFLDNNVNIGAVGDTPAMRQQIHNSSKRSESYGNTDGQLGNMDNEGFDIAVSSPPFLQTSGGTNVTSTEGVLADERLLKRHSAGNAAAEGYGNDENNLGNMQASDDGFSMAVTSPPYAELPVVDARHLHYDERRKEQSIELSKTKPPIAGYGTNEGQLSEMKATENGFGLAISSPPYGGGEDGISQKGGTEGLKKHGTGLTSGEAFFAEYGNTDGQLGSMNTTKDGFDLVSSSLPYADAISRRGGDTATYWDNSDSAPFKIGESNITGRAYSDNPENLGNFASTQSGFDLAASSPPYAEARIGQESGQEQCGHNDAYGETDGQLGGMKGNGFEEATAIVSSPPFEAVTSDRPSASIVEGGLKMGASSMGNGYGETDGQLGNDSGNDFWIAARQIIDQVYASLQSPGEPMLDGEGINFCSCSP